MKGDTDKSLHTLRSSPTEEISLLAFWENQYDPTLFMIWSIITSPSTPNSPQAESRSILRKQIGEEGLRLRKVSSLSQGRPLSWTSHKLNLSYFSGKLTLRTKYEL